MELIYQLYKLGMDDTSVVLKIFDIQIQPILLYSSAMWGMNRFEKIETLSM